MSQTVQILRKCAAGGSGIFVGKGTLPPPAPKPAPAPAAAAPAAPKLPWQQRLGRGTAAAFKAPGKLIDKHPIATGAALTGGVVADAKITKALDDKANAAAGGAGAADASAPAPDAKAPAKPEPGIIDTLKGYGNSATKWIGENPGTAAGIGMGAAGLLYWLLSRNRGDDE